MVSFNASARSLRRSAPVVWVTLGIALAFLGDTVSAAEWRAGFAKVDVTPREPVRMSGYGSRDHPSEGIATRLYVRAAALQATEEGDKQKPLLLVSIDNVGLSGAMTSDLANRIEAAHGVPRSRVAFSNTHTHSAPALKDQLANIFATPLSDAEAAAAARYQTQLQEGLLEAVATALNDLSPARLSYAVGRESFAANRRVLTDGKWSGFGVQADGPVDHTVPVLRVTDPEGTIRGVVFNYACHCTTLGGRYYQINADWAGYAAAMVEDTHGEAVALCTIGCGADANPNPRGTEALAQMHGASLAEEVLRVTKGTMEPVRSAPQTRFDYAALSFELPTREELEARLGESNVQARRHAQDLLKTYQEHGRLPATYPVPIQSWKFGDDLTMVFLGGEVVVDYALRLKRRFDDPDLWVTAYANDVMGYVASERMRAEGGYEFDRSGVYYSLPGPWASGSEDLLIRRVDELVHGRGRAEPKPADGSLKSLRVPDGYRVDLVAAEPLVQDPINLAFGNEGRLWVVEMGDYPEGEGKGRVKVLSDTDGDGRYDKATTFLSGVDFPTGVQPCAEGVLVSAAPDILWARDTDGDDRADEVEPLYRGFPLANPQHRVNGFTYGLDHSWHLAAGANLGEITSVRSGETLNASGHDVQIWPDSGAMALTSGRTQFIRSRDSDGRWFGNSNSKPMYQFPIEDRYLKRNSAVTYSGGSAALFTPAVAPPVFPLTSSSERFNDLFAANRFTSACSSIVARTPLFDDGPALTALICEPVHNLVHRARLEPRGASFAATRVAAEQASEFLASTDPWFRPVRVSIGPDGMIYVVDMYREVIEHPEWIPDAWQQRLNIRAGESLGRIYRIAPKSAGPKALPNLRAMKTVQLLDELRSPIGPRRDLAQQLILTRDAAGARDRLQAIAAGDEGGLAQLHALWILEHQGWLSEPLLADALASSHPGVLLTAIRLSESRLSDAQQERPAGLLEPLARLADHPDASVALQLALTVGEAESPEAADILARIATRPDLDRWLADGVVSSASRHAATVIDALLSLAKERPEQMSETRLDLLTRLMVTARRQGRAADEQVAALLAGDALPLDVRLQLAESMMKGNRSGGHGPSTISELLTPLRSRAQAIAADPSQPEPSRCRAVSLVSLGSSQTAADREFLLALLEPQTPAAVQCEAIDGLVRHDQTETLDQLLSLWPSLSLEVRDHLASRLLSRRDSALRLLTALEAGEISVNEISLAAREQLIKAGNRSMKVRASRLLNRGGSAQRAGVVREYLAQFTSPSRLSPAERNAERKRGKRLYEKHCAVCHAPGEEGDAIIGASLENLTNRSDEALVESVLAPNRTVEPKYQSFVIQTVEGRTLVGVIESEVAGSVTLAHADGKRSTVRREEIERMKSTGTSLMPEGFETTLPPQELQAIVRYLQQR